MKGLTTKMPIVEEMRQRLQAAFAPELLEVVDESEQHRGHAGFREGGESHFHVTIRAVALDGQSRVAQHRAIHAALGDIVPRIHALGLTVRQG